MGRWTVVYQAAASPLHPSADYVLKTLRPDCTDDSFALQMLRCQAYLGQNISDPHLESVLAANLNSAPYYLVTALMEGATVETTLTRVERLDAYQALWFVRQLAEGLQTLHRHGWLHGDIKPANVFVSSDGHATLIDLGLARPIERPFNLRHNFYAGTPAYAAPESGSKSIPAGPHSDVYSLGVTLYEMLTGQLPFTADGPSELLRAHLEQAIPEPRRLAPWLHRRTSRLLRSMLAKDPLRRPSTPELIDWLVDLEIEALPERFAAN